MSTPLLALLLAGCDSSLPRERQAEGQATVQARDAAPPDAMRLLRLDASVTPANVASNGTCITFDASGRSRLIYLMLPAESSYVRLTVVAGQRRPVDLVDLVRGLPDGRLWSATFVGSQGTTTTRLFTSANDKAPVIEVWSAEDSRTRRLTDVAMAAIQSPCA